MTNLSERVMSLSGPSYEMDCLIWDAIYPGERLARFEKLTANGAAYHMRLGPADMDGYVKPLRAFTASIDAAMTLVPEGDPAFSATFWRLGNDGEGADPAEFKAEILLCSMLTSKRLSATASTPALALCAAALLAREASNGDL